MDHLGSPVVVNPITVPGRTRPGGARPLLPESVEFIVVHCSATGPQHAWTVKDVDLAHRQRGWNGCGYHFVIRRDGVVEEGRPLNLPGAHVEGYNARSVGVCLIGGASADLKRPECNFTTAQGPALSGLLVALRKQFPRAVVVGHRGIPGVRKDCPSFNVKRFLATETFTFR